MVPEFGPPRFSKNLLYKGTLSKLHFVNSSSPAATPSKLFGNSQEVKIAHQMLSYAEGPQLEVLPSQPLAMKRLYYKASADAACIVQEEKHI